MSNPSSQFSTGPSPVGEDEFARVPRRRRPAQTDEWRRSFLRMVSHELRTPLNSVIGFSEIISAELYGPIGDERYRDHAKIIRESGMKLLRLVNQVLEIARLDAGAADLHLRPERGSAVARSAMRRLEADAEARDVHLRLQLDPETPLVMADPHGLETILANLLQNAIAFSPEGGEVVIDIRPVGHEVQFTIIDAGPGVPEQDIPRLLLPFTQGESALTRRSEGAGLGLPIVRLLCRDMGGRLRLSSPPGAGLIARVTLTAAAEESPRPA